MFLIQGFQGGRTDTEDGNIKSGQVLGKRDGKKEELSVIMCIANAMAYPLEDAKTSNLQFQSTHFIFFSFLFLYQKVSTNTHT